MANLNFELASSPPDDWASRLALQALDFLRAGNAAGAAEASLRSLASKSDKASTWSNLAAYALMTGNPQAARKRAQRALQCSPLHADAMVNLAAAVFAEGDLDGAVGSLRQAISAQPGHAKAVANLGLLLHAAQQFDEAEAMLARAVAANPGNARLTLARARAAQRCRSSEQTQMLALVALERIAGTLPATLLVQPKTPKPLGDATAALGDAIDVLTLAGQPFHLMAGTLLGLVRDGNPLPHDKDIDLALPYECDRNEVVRIFLESGKFSVPARPESDEPLWAFGVVHAHTGIVVDLFFARAEPDGVRFGFGLAPLQVFGKVRPYASGSLRWNGRDCPVPQPPENYLEDIYGPHWRRPDPYFDTVLSNPSRSPESLPVAINHGLLRLADALENGQWQRAHSLCDQLLARDAFPPVVQLRALLSQRCPALSA